MGPAEIGVVVGLVLLTGAFLDAVVVALLLAIGFHLAAAPVATHVIGRAAYRTGAPLSRRTAVDELGGREPGPGDRR